MNQASTRAWSLRAILTSVVVCLGLAAAAPVYAQSDTDRLREVIAEATKLAIEGKYDEAITLYFQAKTIKDDPLLDYNIARCYHKKGDCTQATRFYKSVLGRTDADPETLGDAQKYLDELGECPADTAVATNDVKPDPEVKPDPKPDPRPDPKPEPKGMSTLGYAAWASLIGGGALFTTGLIVDVASAGLGDELEDAAAEGDAAEFNSLKDDIDSRQTTIFVLYGVGLVAAATGGVLLFLDGGAESSGENVSWTPVVAPLVSPDGAGASMMLKF